MIYWIKSHTFFRWMLRCDRRANNTLPHLYLLFLPCIWPLRCILHDFFILSTNNLSRVLNLKMGFVYISLNSNNWSHWAFISQIDSNYYWNPYLVTHLFSQKFFFYSITIKIKKKKLLGSTTTWADKKKKKTWYWIILYAKSY